MIIEEAQEEYIKLQFIAKKTKNIRHAKMAIKLAHRIKKRYLYKNLSKTEISVITKKIFNDSDNFNLILKRNIIREYGKMVYNVWEHSSRN